MHSEILDARLSAAETAILKLDERIDADGGDDHAQALAAYEARIASLEATLTECIARLQTTETSLSEAMARTAEAQAQEAEAVAVEALAEAPTPEQEAITPEETADEEIAELEPETESESAGAPGSNRPSWWENLFALR